MQVQYVLGQWTNEEIKALKPRIEMSCKAIEAFALAGLNTAMNEYNGK